MWLPEPLTVAMPWARQFCNMGQGGGHQTGTAQGAKGTLLLLDSRTSESCTLCWVGGRPVREGGSLYIVRIAAPGFIHDVTVARLHSLGNFWLRQVSEETGTRATSQHAGMTKCRHKDKLSGPGNHPPTF